MSVSASDVMAGAAVIVAGLGAVLTFRNSSRATDVSEDKIEIERAVELRADAKEARDDARTARTEAAQARQLAVEAHRRMDEVVSYLGWILRLIHDPNMTIEQLRDEVGNSVPPASVGSRSPRREHP